MKIWKSMRVIGLLLTLASCGGGDDDDDQIEPLNEDSSTMKVFNDGRYSVSSLRMSTSTDSAWGENLLGDGILSSGEFVPIYLIKPCDREWDIEAKYFDGHELREIGYYLECNTTYTWSLKH